MNSDPAKSLQSKREFRQRLAARPIVEKLALLDALRDRELALRPEQSASKTGLPREILPPYRIRGDNAE